MPEPSQHEAEGGSNSANGIVPGAGNVALAAAEDAADDSVGVAVEGQVAQGALLATAVALRATAATGPAAATVVPRANDGELPGLPARQRKPEHPEANSGVAAAARAAASSSGGGGGGPAPMFSVDQVMQAVETANAVAAADRDHARAEAQQLRDGAARTERERARAESELAVCAAAKLESARNLALLLREVALQQAVTSRRNLAEQQRRLGKFVAVRVAVTHMEEQWEDGEDFIQLAAKEERHKADVLALKPRLNERRKRSKRKRDEVGSGEAGGSAARGRGNARGGAAARGPAPSHSDDDDDGEPGVDDAAEVGSDVSDLFRLGGTLQHLGPVALSAAAGAGAGRAGSPGAMLLQLANGAAGGALDGVQRELELVELDETLKYAQAALKREEAQLAERRRALELEKVSLIVEMRRQLDESCSRFRGSFVMPGGRYMLMELLGKGGFGEVWRAIDLHSATEVAVKIHTLEAHWSDVRKATFRRKSRREYETQELLAHPNIVGLLDKIEITENSFATVLEYCPGGNLDHVLKQQYAGSYMAERDARAIIIQVLLALRYLNGYVGGAVPATTTPGGAGAGASASSSSSSSAAASSGASAMPPPPSRRCVIHFDLKPANILFDAQRSVKVADFGLCQNAEDRGDGRGGSLELTSHCGTYWYLPPEVQGGGPGVRISNKVDVWSVGVIFYQMLYGRRPFGEGMGQEQLLQQGAIVVQARVGPLFPPGPRVSDDAKAFIRRCLTFEPAARPDILSICDDPYLRKHLR